MKNETKATIGAIIFLLFIVVSLTIITLAAYVVPIAELWIAVKAIGWLIFACSPFVGMHFVLKYQNK